MRYCASLTVWAIFFSCATGLLAADWKPDWKDPGADGAGRTGRWDFTNGAVKYIVDGYHPDWGDDEEGRKKKSDFDKLVDEAFAEWDKLICNTGPEPTFVRTEVVADKNISVRFRDFTGTPIADAAAFAMPKVDEGMPAGVRNMLNALKGAGFEECQIYLNSAKPWYIDPTPAVDEPGEIPTNTWDALSVVKHEIAHKLGIWGHPLENINGTWKDNGFGNTQQEWGRGVRRRLTDWDGIMMGREIPGYDIHASHGWCKDYVSLTDPRGSSPLAWGAPYIEIPDGSISPENPLTVDVAGGLWLAHGNIYVPGYTKYVTFELTYEAEKELTLGGSGAGYFSWGGTPTTELLTWESNLVDGVYNLVIQLKIDPQPDWEWVYLVDDPGTIKITGLSITSICVPLPAGVWAGLVMLAVVAGGRLGRGRRRLGIGA